jgi:outer membrane lipoprotein SlyB
MNAATQAAPATAPQSSLAAVPRAIWIALGTLAIATAGLTGAMVMRAIDSKPAAVPVAALQPAAAVAPQVTTESQVAPTQTAAAHLQAPSQAAIAETQAQPAPAKVAKPKPQPAPSRQPTQQMAQSQSPSYTPVETTRAAVCATCGTVESVQAVKEKGQGTGLGAVGGAVVGGLLGNQVGGGNGKKVMTVVGAVGGGLAGHEAEKHVRATTAYDVQVRMEDGSVRSFRRAEPMSVGTRVTVEGNSLRVGTRQGSGSAPRAIYTSS